MSLTYGNLFAGYGGLEMGVQSVLGGTTSWVAEFDKAPSKILAHHYPDVPNLGDVTKVDWHSVPKVDVITGGSPCQDLSHAGKRAGMKAGTRSGLWASMCDAIDIIRPRLVVWENVRGALSAEADSELEHCPGCMGDPGDGGPVLRALGRVLGDLAELGFDARWYGLRAADVGAPHGRFRIFLFATPADTNGAGWGKHGGAFAVRPEHAAVERAGAKADMTLLPTPVSDNSRGLPSSGTDYQSLPNAVVSLLPTPTTTQRGTDANLDTREGARANLHNEVAKLADDRHDLVWSDIADAYVRKEDRESIEASTLREEAERREMEADYDWMDSVDRLLPTPSVADGMGGHLSRSGSRSDELLLPGVAKDLAERNLQEWGDYGPAIARWEALTRPAPAPTEVSPQSKKGCPIHASAQEGRPREGVRDVRGAAGAQEVQERATGGSRSVPASNPLLAGVREHEGRGCEGHAPLEGAPAATGRLPGVLDDDQPARPPHRPEPIEQQPVESGDAVRELPPEAALARGSSDEAGVQSVGARCSCKQRLSADFVCWMMGLPEGWVDVEGVSRNEQLKALGNGVVPQQVAAATRAFLADIAGDELGLFNLGDAS